MLSVTPTEEEQMKTIRINCAKSQETTAVNEHWRFFIARMVGVRGKLRIC